MLPSLPRFLCIFAVLSGLLPGCTTTPATPDQLEAPPDEIASVVDQGLVPVARYGRYTLVELVPEPAQRDLLQQAVEVSIPPMLDASVRSEEHTSELQSLMRISYAVFCLKKKKKTTTQTQYNH